MNCQDLIGDFRRQFADRPSRVFFSPGRVNLIGEHTDYNGGYVLPVAIDRGTYYAVRASDSSSINVYSRAFDERLTIPLAGLEGRTAEGNWGDYVTGSMLELNKRSLLGGRGLDICIGGDLPRDSGLSSSASLTVGTLFLLNDIWECGLERLDLVRMAKAVENDFIGLQCGIMDQFAVAMATAEQAICLHCHSLQFNRIPLYMEGYEIVVTDSRVPRKLSESSYNRRREECRRALEALQRVSNIEYLCAATPADMDHCDALDADPVIRRRARHVISENRRVLESARLMEKGNLAGFGKLMYASHASLRDDFEVSCKELDILVDSARGIEGVLGSRMTGAGFGGCTVSIVATDAIPDFVAEISAAYSAATPFEAKIMNCRTSDGVKELNR